MTAGTILGALGFLAAAGNIATYYPKMTSNHATLRPRREQAVMLAALALAIASFFLEPGIVGTALGLLAIVPAGLFLLGTATSGLPVKPLGIAPGAPAPL